MHFVFRFSNHLQHLIAAHRYLVKDGILTIIMLVQYDGSKPKKIKKPFHFYLFNDILVFMREGGYVCLFFLFSW